MKKKLVFFTLSSLVSQAALASDPAMDKKIEMLEKQINELQSVVKDLKKQTTEANAKAASAVKATQQQAATKPSAKSTPVSGDNTVSLSDVKITMSPSPKIESADGATYFQPFGRLHTDYAIFQDDKTDHPDGGNIRSARLGFQGAVARDWQYKFDVDFGNRSSTQTPVIKDAFLRYKGFEKFDITVGNFKPEQGMDQLTSSNYTMFIERALPITTFTTDEIIGAKIETAGDNWSFAFGGHNDSTNTKSTDDEAKSVNARATFAPFHESGKVLHLGASIAYKTPDNATNSLTLSSVAENSIQQKLSANTGAIGNIADYTVSGLELAGSYGPFTTQSEYIQTNVDRKTGGDLSFNGWYTEASFMLTGESKPYDVKTGLFGRLKPKNNFSPKDGTWGAVEVAARYSTIDLNDLAIAGGAIDDITLGVNWYLNPYVRFMTNYIMVNTDNVTPQGANVAADDDPNILLFRMQVDF